MRPQLYWTKDGRIEIDMSPGISINEGVRLKPFLYCIVKNPTKNEADQGDEPQIVAHGMVMARDDKHAALLAGAQNPGVSSDKGVDVLTRPF